MPTTPKPTGAICVLRRVNGWTRSNSDPYEVQHSERSWEQLFTLQARRNAESLLENGIVKQRLSGVFDKLKEVLRHF